MSHRGRIKQRRRSTQSVMKEKMKAHNEEEDAEGRREAEEVLCFGVSGREAAAEHYASCQLRDVRAEARAQ